MKNTQPQDLSPEDKKLLNVLEIKLYDISQNAEIIGKQLTNNQIKEIASQSYHISQQLKSIYEKCGVSFLYQLQRKMQVNSILICSLLTDRLEKQKKKTQIVCKCQLSQSNSQKEVKEEEKSAESLAIPLNNKIPRLGGVHLYNESYARGLQILNLFHKDSDSRGGKLKTRTFKSCKEQFITAVMQEIDDKAEVEVAQVHDEIKSYIDNFKESSRLPNLFSCENELQEIIDFFKMSELEAITFLNKSPNNNEYTQDYLNRLSDMENDIKTKEKLQKYLLLGKMKEFGDRLRDKISQVEQQYEKKKQKLKQYELSLVKETVCEATQTYDGYQRKMKQLENQLKEQEEKYKILNEIRKVEEDYENKIHTLNQIIDIKNNENKKLLSAKQEIQQQIESLKKTFREKNERLTAKFESEKKKNRMKNMLMDSLSEEKNQEDTSNLSQRPSLLKDELIQRKLRKYDKTGNFSSGSHRISIDTEKYKMFETAKGDFYTVDAPVDDIVDTEKISQIPKDKTLCEFATLDAKDSGFKIEFKRSGNSKKTAEYEEKQVSFMIGGNSEISQIEKTKIQEAVLQNKFEMVRERSFEKSRSLVSLQEEAPRRSNRKNTLKQKIDSVTPRSMRELEDDDCKKSSRSVSKKCVILKEKKQKNIITTIMKIDKLTINKQLEIIIQPTLLNKQYKKQKTEEDHSEIDSKLTFQKSNKNFKHKKTQKSLQIKNGFNRSKKELLEKNKKKGADYGQNISDCPQSSSIKAIIEEERFNREKSVKSISSIKKIKNKNNVSLKKIDQSSISNKQSKTIEEMAQRPSVNKLNHQGQSELYKSESNSISAQTSLLANLIKKMGGKDKKNSQLLKTIDQPNKYKFISQYLELIKKEGTENQIKSRDSKIKELISEDFYSKIQYLKEEVLRQNLSIEEFQEMIKIFSYAKEYVDYEEKPQQSQENSDFKCFKPIGENTESLVQLHKKEQRKRPSIEAQKFVRYAESNLYLTGFEIQKMKNIHSLYGKCPQMENGNHFCHHIEKYIGIINKINKNTMKTKVPLKLPIEKIGQMSHDKSRDQLYQYTNKKSKISYEQNLRLPRASEHNTHPYVASNLTTEGEQRQRILPIINNTTSTYYKPKSKILR